MLSNKISKNYEGALQHFFTFHFHLQKSVFDSGNTALYTANLEKPEYE